MSAFRPRLRALVVGAAALALVAIGVGGTVAASNPPTLYACFNVNGAVAMSTTAQCKLAGGGQLATINAAGVAGPQGDTGEADDERAEARMEPGHGSLPQTDPATGRAGPSRARGWARVWVGRCLVSTGRCPG